MKKFFRENFKAILFLFIGLLILWMVTRGQDINRLVEEFRDANYWWIILIMGISVLSHVVRSLRWRLLIKQLNYYPSNYRVFYALMTGYLANILLPRVGELSRCVALKKTDNIPINKLIGTVIAERFFDMACLLTILFFVIVLQFNLLKSYIYNYILNPIVSNVETNYLWFILISLTGFLLFIIIFVLVRRIVKNSLPSSLLYKGKIHLDGIKSGLFSMVKMKNKTLFLLYTVALWTLYFLMVYVGFFAISALSHLGFFAALSVLALGSIGVAIPVPAGIGTYHFVVMTSLTELFKVGSESAMSFAYLTHASQLLVFVVVGGFAWFKLAMKKSQMSYKEILEENNNDI